MKNLIPVYVRRRIDHGSFGRGSNRVFRMNVWDRRTFRAQLPKRIRNATYQSTAAHRNEYRIKLWTLFMYFQPDHASAGRDLASLEWMHEKAPFLALNLLSLAEGIVRAIDHDDFSTHCLTGCNS